MKVIILSPAATVTLGGKIVAALVLDSVTSSPPVGAGPVNVKFAVEDVPPVTIAEVKLRLVGVGAFTVRLAVFVTVP